MIIKFREGSQWFVTDGDPKDYKPDGQEIAIDDPLVTIEALVQIWEMKLEGENYHSMSSVPSHLVEVLIKHGVPESTVKQVLWDIIDSGGWMS